MWSNTQKEYIHHNLQTHVEGKYALETTFLKWQRSFVLVLLQYGLNLWEEQNNHVHGDSPENQRFIKRKKVIQRAKDIYQQGEGRHL